MTEVQLPERPTRTAMRAVLVAQHDLGGVELWAVTLHLGAAGSPRRRWFASREIALAHAADRSDEHNVPVFDLTDPDGEQ